MEWDFCGYATKNDLRCDDGRIIRKDAFKPQDGTKVPLCWNHQHNSPQDVLGHAVLENRDDGVYAYCKFNNTPSGQDAKEQVKNGDIESLSIWANNLVHKGREVVHGVIREVSLVFAGANPGAFIESVMAHSEPMDEGDDEGIFYSGEGIELYHAAETKKEEPEVTEESKNAEGSGKTVREVLDTLNDEQKTAVAIIVGQAVADAQSGNDEDEEGEEMTHSAFEKGAPMSYDNSYAAAKEAFADLLETAKKNKVSSLRELVHSAFEEEEELMHALDLKGMEQPTIRTNQNYGFRDPEMLFPDYKATSNVPEWISRDMAWVTRVLGGVKHVPFTRIKSLYANITEDEARARGYIRGTQKKEEFFKVIKRTTDPQTIYKLQKLDRDDIIDITDFDVVMWIKGEMRVMLNEEIARAILLGDGRTEMDESKIKEDHIRPVVKDVPLFNVMCPVTVPVDADAMTISKAFIRAVIKTRKDYKGSGNPTLWTNDDVLSDALLLEDAIDHRLYKTEVELSTALRVRDIVTVEPMEGYEIEDSGKKKRQLLGVVWNPMDYTVGTNRGGQITTFDDFDIDFNQYKYLIETRMSGALTKPFSAMTYYLVKEGE